MRNGKRIGVVIPALNEERAIAKVLADIPDWVDQVVVADNGSTDATPSVAEAGGAVVVHEPERGYGAACLRGIAALDAIDVVVFLDGDYSDHPEEMVMLVDPIADDQCDLVIGSRVLGEAEAGALTPQQRFGNWLACFLMRLRWRVRYSDLGPFRAIAAPALHRIDMQDRNFGWTIEMQIKAAVAGLRSREVPVRYRPRIGVSKISGTIKGSIMAGIIILSTIGRFAFRQPATRAATH